MSGLEGADLEIAEHGFQPVWQGNLADYVTAIAISPTGQSWAASSTAGEVSLWTLETQKRVALCPSHGSAIDALAFSPDGTFLAAAGQAGTVQIWHLKSSQPELITTLENSPVWIDKLAWQPQTHHLAYSLGRNVQIWDAKAQATLATLRFEESSVLDLAWHPQGSHLAIAGYHGVKTWDAQNWAAEPQVLDIPSASVAIAWSPDGRYLAAGNLDRTLAVVEWGNPAPWLMQGFPGKIRQLAWSAPRGGDSCLAVASGNSAVVWEKDLDEAIGWNGQILGNHEARIAALAFQPGTTQLATVAADGWIGLWDPALVQTTLVQTALVQALDGAPQGFTCLGWHPQGTYLAAGGQQGELLLWELASL